MRRSQRSEEGGEGRMENRGGVVRRVHIPTVRRGRNTKKILRFFFFFFFFFFFLGFLSFVGLRIADPREWCGVSCRHACRFAGLW